MPPENHLSGSFPGKGAAALLRFIIEHIRLCIIHFITLPARKCDQMFLNLCLSNTFRRSFWSCKKKKKRIIIEKIRKWVWISTVWFSRSNLSVLCKFREKPHGTTLRSGGRRSTDPARLAADVGGEESPWKAAGGPGRSPCSESARGAFCPPALYNCRCSKKVTSNGV